MPSSNRPSPCLSVSPASAVKDSTSKKKDSAAEQASKDSASKQAKETESVQGNAREAAKFPRLDKGGRCVDGARCFGFCQTNGYCPGADR